MWAGIAFGKATRYGLDGPWIESRWGRAFPYSSRPALGSTQPHIQWARVSFLEVNRPGRGVDHPPPSSAEVKEWVELYFPPSGPSWPDLGWPLPLPQLHCSGLELNKQLPMILNCKLEKFWRSVMVWFLPEENRYFEFLVGYEPNTYHIQCALQHYVMLKVIYVRLPRLRERIMW
jgi:hypothetical protein